MNLECLWFRAGFVWCVYSWIRSRTDIMNLIYIRCCCTVYWCFRNYPFSVLFGYVRVDLYHLWYFVGELDVAFERVVLGYCAFILLTIMSFGNPTTFMGFTSVNSDSPYFLFHIPFLFQFIFVKELKFKIVLNYRECDHDYFLFYPTSLRYCRISSAIPIALHFPVQFVVQE
jgi:hypothetical protein